MESRDGKVVRALAFHQHGVGSTPSVNAVVQMKRERYVS